MTETKPPPPLPPGKGALGCGLGIMGLALYSAGIQLASDGMLVRWFGLSRSSGPIVAGIGCSIFCVSVAVIWRLSMKTLVTLVVLAGVMIWGVTAVKEANDERRGGQDRPQPVTGSSPSSPVIIGSTPATNLQPDTSQPTPEADPNAGSKAPAAEKF